METIPQQGSDRPAFKYLNRYVVMEIAHLWHDVGTELLETGEEAKLRVMLDKYSSNSKEASKEMLLLWLDGHFASWNQLIEALKLTHIGLRNMACKLEEMLSKGGDDIEESQPATKKQRSDQSFKVDVIEIDFNSSEYEDVVHAFTELMTILHDNVPESRLPVIKARCIAVTGGEFGECIDQADDVNKFFALLSKNTLYCNWLSISLLKVIAIASGSKKLTNVVDSYERAICSRKLQQVLKNIPRHKVKTKYYSKVRAKFDSKNPDNVTVGELISCSKKLANKIALLLMDVTANCLSITWLIPTDKVYQLLMCSLTVPQESREEDFLQIGTWEVYHPQCVLQRLKMEFAMASPLTLLIGYYHAVLLRDINADLLFDDVCSKHLITVYDQSLISAAYSVHHRNWLLLEHVRHMDTKAFVAFCELIQKLWPEVGSQLITVSDIIPDIQDKATGFKEAQATSHDSHNQVLIFKPSSVHIAFLCLIDQMDEILKCCDVRTLITQCEEMMACEQENIKLFSNVQIKKLKEYDNALLILSILNCFISWSNHSILRMLLTELSSEAIQILDEFDSRLDPLQSIVSYPIPHFSSGMVPSDTSTHTILAVRCDQKLYKSTLQYVYDMQSAMMEKCGITQHCLQLLAVRSSPTILYWTIPECVVNLISIQVPLHAEYLYSKGVLEVIVYPELVLNTGDDVSIGSLAFSAESKDDHDEELPNLMSKLQLKLMQKDSAQVMGEKQSNLRQDMEQTESEQHIDQSDQDNNKEKNDIMAELQETYHKQCKEMEKMKGESAKQLVTIKQLNEDLDQAQSELSIYKQLKAGNVSKRLSRKLYDDSSQQAASDTKTKGQSTKEVTEIEQSDSVLSQTNVLPG